MQINMTKAKRINGYNLDNNIIYTDDSIYNHNHDNSDNGRIIMRIKIKN